MNARSRFQKRYQREARGDRDNAAPVAGRSPYPCDPRAAGPDAYVCKNETGRLGYGQYYAFTPSYVSSPQLVGDDPRVQTSVLPLITSLFWAANSLRFDPHD